MDDLVDYVRHVFALDTASPASLTADRRGALGRIFCLQIGSMRYALKEIFDADGVDPLLLAAEVDFTRYASAAGIRVAASHPAADGRYAIPTPDGSGWLRLYEWLDADGADVDAPDLPARLGTLVGRMHRCAPRSDREPDGSPPDAWYDTPPSTESLTELVQPALAAHAPWAPALEAGLPMIATIAALATPADPARMVTCHRDLHPENVLVDRNGTGELIVIDWDNLGPADPSRELARILLDWFYDNGTLAADSVRAMLTAYRATGAPGRLAADRDPATVFGFAIASRLNFLAVQIAAWLDPASASPDRDWAADEIDEALRMLPTPAAFDQIVAIDRSL